MTLVYEGVRILDFTQLEQGPSGTQVLADYGADVIKIERIDVGEIGRDHAPKVRGMSPHWAANNRNKRSLSIDVKNPEGLRILHRLAETADIVASNFRPGVMERLGLGYGDLSAINPRIICAYASGYGQTGPYRDRRGQDLAAQAMGGVMALTGSAEGPPTPVGTFAIDYIAAMHFAQGMMLALAAREKTGRGQMVDSCLLNSAVALHLQEGTTYLNTGRAYPRPPKGVAHIHNTALYAQYVCRDGKSLVLVGEFYITEPWRRVCRAVGLPDKVAADPRFQTIDGLLDEIDLTYDVLAAAFAKLERDDAIKRLEAEDVLAAPVNEYPDVFADPQVLHNEMILNTQHPAVGSIRLVGMPVKLSATPGTLRHAPPTVGQDNEAVLLDAGYDAEQVAAWKTARVIGSENDHTRGRSQAAW
jgi:crotonobetainyl-CoA:carnitine CoA-transferase CaiB-like acyl-CoA transferase